MKTSERVELDVIRKRLASHLAVASRKYPQAWRQLDELRAGRKRLGDWPSWCFCPLHGSYAVVSTEVGDEAMDPLPSGDEQEDKRSPILDVGRMGCLGAWRPSQGIYWIDETLREAILETPCDKEIPIEVLFEIPQWCVYIALPGEMVGGREIYGFFAYLEYHQQVARTELRLVVDYLGEPFSSLESEILHIHRGETLEQAFERFIVESKRIGDTLVSRELAEEAMKIIRALGSKRLEPLMSCLLYLCSKTAEYRQEGERETSKPSRPSAKKTKDGWRFFAPDKPKVWHVGERLGEAIRAVHDAERPPQAERAGPRPHVRRAHWHTYWLGPRDSPQRHPELRWLPPFAVALAEDKDEPDRNARRILNP